MLNSEIGTYQLAEAIAINPKLNVVFKEDQVVAKINGFMTIGNKAILESTIDCSKLKVSKTLINNEIKQDRDPKEVLSDVYGISNDADWDLVYKPEDVWRHSERIATNKKETKKRKFKLDDDTGHL